MKNKKRMKSIKKGLKKYIYRLKNRKPVFFILAGLMLFAEWGYLLFRYKDFNAGELLGLMVLSLAAASLVVLPRMDEKLPDRIMAAVFVLLVPVQCFIRTEMTVTGNMKRIKPEAALFNVFIYFLVFLLFYAIIRRCNIAFLAGLVLSLLFMLSQYYVVKFRGDMFSPAELKSTKTAMGVIAAYDFTPGKEALKSIYWYLFFAVFALKIKDPGSRKECNIAGGICLIPIALFGIIFFGTNLFARMNLYPYLDILENNQFYNGTTAGFVLLMKSKDIETAGMGEFEQYAEMSEAEPEEEKKEFLLPEIQPDIILIMNEAWSDLSVLGDMEMNEPIMPYLDYLRNDCDNAISGYCHVEVIGGLTCNSEFEALTGDSIFNMNVTAVPYNTMISKETVSLASVLKEYGYAAEALHPWTGTTWNRRTVYSNLGFDRFTELEHEEFVAEYRYSPGGFITDECNVEELLYLYENRDTSKPWFMFNVTVQNHSAAMKKEDSNLKALSVNGDTEISNENRWYLEGYLDNIQETDLAMQSLFEYFEEVETPTIICIFGDHQPLFPEALYEQLGMGKDTLSPEDRMRKYMTPYIIWSNYENEWDDYGDISLNYLSPILLELADYPQTNYFQFLMELREEYPVLTLNGCYDKEKNYYSASELKERDELKEYHYLEYKHITEEGNSEIFMP